MSALTAASNPQSAICVAAGSTLSGSITGADAGLPCQECTSWELFKEELTEKLLMRPKPIGRSQITMQPIGAEGRKSSQHGGISFYTPQSFLHHSINF